MTMPTDPNDLVRRLRVAGPWLLTPRTLTEAAAEIERLRTALAYAKEHLSGIREIAALAEVQKLERQALQTKEERDAPLSP